MKPQVFRLRKKLNFYVLLPFFAGRCLSAEVPASRLVDSREDRRFFRKKNCLSGFIFNFDFD